MKKTYLLWEYGDTYLLVDPSEVSYADGVKIYEWWDGSNFRRETLEPHRTEIAVEITEKSVCLDEWDGRNWQTGGVGHHEYVHLVIAEQGKKEDDTFLLVHRSQWQGEHPTARIVDLEDLRSRLRELGRDEAKYLYEIGTLAGEIVPELIGSKEFYELLGWSKERFNMIWHRQKEGKNVRMPLPEPVAILAVTPVWTRAQAEEFIRLVQEKEKKKSK